jgi:hypothetical protein
LRHFNFKQIINKIETQCQNDKDTIKN